jgi:hypothetical protein
MNAFNQGDEMLRFERLYQREIVTHPGPGKANVKYLFISVRHRRVPRSWTVSRRDSFRYRKTWAGKNDPPKSGGQNRAAINNVREIGSLNNFSVGSGGR